MRHTVLPLGDLAVNQRLFQRLSWLEQSQWWDRERVEAERNQRLAALIDIAYREVPFYRDLLDEARVKPADIRCPEDLLKLPIVTKAMLRANYPHRTCRDTGFRTYEVATSGSTGANFRTREDMRTAGWYRASFLLALDWAGWHIGERHLQTGMNATRSLDRRLKDWVLRCHYVSAAQLSDATLDQHLDVIDRYRLSHVWGYPGSLYFLARRARQLRWNRPLRSLVTWGDSLHPHFRTTIEDTFQCRVHDTYGVAEGFQISAQCGHGSTYHNHAFDTVVEYVNDAGDPVPEGQPGNLIVTRLWPGPMPFIRYQIGDVGVSARSRSCACGRHWEVMESIQGRATDNVVTPTGNRLVVHFFTGLLETFPEIDSFQVLQERVESMTLRIVPTALYSAESETRIKKTLHERGADLNIEIERVKEIPLTPGGKRRFVLSSVGRVAVPPELKLGV